jgi:hypothetical protein
VYGIFIADVRLDSLTYGLVNYELHRHALMCVAPGQIGGKTARAHTYVQEVLWLSTQSLGQEMIALSLAFCIFNGQKGQ